MTASTFANILPFAVLLACLFRARLLALALVPPCALIALQWLDLVDTSSASHPLRWVVSVSCAGLAGMAAAYELTKERERRFKWERRRVDMIATMGPHWEHAWPAFKPHTSRALIASYLVFASNGPDLLALHPFFWATFAEWPLVPLQIGVCVTILGVLWAPERWVEKWIR